MLIQPPLWEPESSWTQPDLFSFRNEKMIAIDLETNDPDIKKGLGPRGRGYIIGIAVATPSRSGYYPIAHEGGDNLPLIPTMRWFKDELEAFRGEITGANLGYDLDWLLDAGVVFHHEVRFRDVQVAEPLLDELQFKYSLQAIADRYGVAGKDETLLTEAASLYDCNKKSEMWKLPPRFVGAYAEQDVRLPLDLIMHQHKLMKAQNLWDVYEMESEILPITVEMRRRGVKVNLDKVQNVQEWAKSECARYMAEASRIAGVRLRADEVNKKKPLAAAFDKLGIPYTMTDGARPQPQIDQAFLKQAGPLGKAVMEARKADRISTFADTIWAHEVKGRIHGSFHQLRREKDDGAGQGTVTGRFSSSDPNLQQQPGASFWREIYEPDGELWACCDFSSQEPRLAVHFASLLGLRGADNIRDQYRRDPNCDLHNWTTEVVFGRTDTESKEFQKLRKQCKVVFLGILYGMGGGKMCAQLGLPTILKDRMDGSGKYLAAGSEGQAILDTYHQTLPWVKQLAKIAQAKAEDVGEVRTLLKRACRFPEREFAYKALNRVIQGSAADQTKKALLDVWKAGYIVQLQVHDEIDLSVNSRKEAEEVGEIMRNAVQLEVPSKLDVEVGPNWGNVA